MKVYNLWEVVDGGGRMFVMTAPLATITKFLRLHREAEERIVRETNAGTLCHLFGNGHHVVGLGNGVVPGEG